MTDSPAPVEPRAEPAGVLERRRAGALVASYDLYRVAEPIAPILDPVE